jgi:exosortase/archaeosortase family protein
MTLKKQPTNILGIPIRYIILILAALFDLWIFYEIFTPLTIYPVYFISRLFSNASIIGDVIRINGSVSIELIKACIAGSAYYLLFILNMTVSRIKIGKRIQMIAFSFASLLILNIARIIALIIIYLNKNPSFAIIHEIFWYVFGTIFVVGIWFAEVKIFKIKEIPVYSDIKLLLKEINNRKHHNKKR